ncbi:hypothetical protein [Nitrospira sp. BLG_2]|uniref:hypothetical protein n=1 Tax=Nitrospira sp. BLG_2 TaxID=3397507 RepID=UPI003B9AA5EF
MNRSNKRTSRKKRLIALLSESELQLFEAWRQQHAFGRVSRSHALRGLIAIYLGHEPWGTPNAPGYGAAWVHAPGWNLKDPRSTNIEQRTGKIEQELGIGGKRPALRLV